MATGASTADVAILLVDARHGVRVAVATARADRAAPRHHRLRARREQDGPGRLRSRACSTTSATSSTTILPGRAAASDSDQRAARRQRHHAQRRGRRGSTGRRCSNTSRTSRSIGTRGRSRSASRCSSCSGRAPIFAGTPDRSCPERCTWATRSRSRRLLDIQRTNREEEPFYLRNRNGARHHNRLDRISARPLTSSVISLWNSITKRTAKNPASPNAIPATCWEVMANSAGSPA